MINDNSARNTAPSSVTVGRSTAPAPSCTVGSAIRQNTVVPSAIAIDQRSVESASQLRSVRGEKFVLASWTATSIIDRSSVTVVMSAPAMVANTTRLDSTLVSNAAGRSRSPIPRSTASVI